MSQKNNENEIDIFKIFEIIWKFKFELISILLVSVVVALIYNNAQPKIYKATTAVKPIGIIESSKYDYFNSLELYEINSAKLFNLYIEQLEERKYFKDAIRKFGLIDESKFENKIEFNQAVTKLSYAIQILLVKDENILNGSIYFEYDNKLLWKQILSFVHENVTQSVKQIIRSNFEMAMINERFKNDSIIEDLEVEIENAINDYYRETNGHLVFLREQAALARKLGVAKNTIEAQTFILDSEYLVNESIIPFYLRGFEAIEKEIELIERRENIKPFIKDLNELENSLRSQKQSKQIDRAENFFNQFLDNSESDFSAVRFAVESTTFDRESNEILIILLSVFMGGIAGAIYIFFFYAILGRK